MSITSKELKQLQGGIAPKRNKYGAIPTEYNGVRYSSKAEARRAEHLDTMMLYGVVLWWIGQPKFRLGVAECVYVADFLVAYKDIGMVAEDVKGKMTAKFRRDVRLWKAYGRIPLHIIKTSGNGWKTESIEVNP